MLKECANPACAKMQLMKSNQRFCRAACKQREHERAKKLRAAAGALAQAAAVAEAQEAAAQATEGLAAASAVIQEAKAAAAAAGAVAVAATAHAEAAAKQAAAAVARAQAAEAQAAEAQVEQKAMADENASKKARTYVPPASCPQCKKLATLDPVAVLWQDQLWVVVHKKPPCGVVGHLQLLSKRHFRACHSFPIRLHNPLLPANATYSPPVCVLHAEGPSTMNDDEAAAVGLALRRCEFILEQVSGCDRVYTAALGSPKSGGHFHAHMMPIFDDAPPKHVTGTPFDVFLQEKLAADGVEGAEADAGECAKLAAAFKECISSDEGQAAAADGKGD